MTRRIFVVPAIFVASMVASIVSTSQAQAQYQPYLGQMMETSFNFCPRGWAQASGQLLPINQNQALFSLLGTQFGGNGTTTFALPNLNGRTPIGSGQGSGLPNYYVGEQGGVVSFTLNSTQLPAHTHTVKATNVLAERSGPLDKYLGLSVNAQYYAGPPNGTMAADMLTATGNGQPVGHRAPYLVMKWCIALQGIFPSQN